MLKHMKQAGLEFEVENNAAGYLRINIEHQEGEIELTQPGLIDFSIVAIGLQHTNPAKVPQGLSKEKFLTLANLTMPVLWAYS
eukprot:15337191-Ditylum_brightwellii.AAC.1